MTDPDLDTPCRPAPPTAELTMDWGIVALGPHDETEVEIDADVDVLFQVLSGSGRLTTEDRTVELTPGNLVWLPRRLRRRQFTAGPGGLRCAMAHRNR